MVVVAVFIKIASFFVVFDLAVDLTLACKVVFCCSLTLCVDFVVVIVVVVVDDVDDEAFISVILRPSLLFVTLSEGKTFLGPDTIFGFFLDCSESATVPFCPIFVPFVSFSVLLVLIIPT